MVTPESGEHVHACPQPPVPGTFHKTYQFRLQGVPWGVSTGMQPIRPLGTDTSVVAQNPRTSAPPSLPAPRIQAEITIQVKECKDPHHSLVREMGRKREPSMTLGFQEGNLLLNACNVCCFSERANLDHAGGTT